MIVTLTANPSHDRTVTLPEPLSRGAVQRAASVLVAGRRQGRQHLPRRRSPPACRRSPCSRRRATTTRSCSSCSPPASTAGRSSHPGDLRVNITISEPDGTTTKLNSPGPAMTDATRASLTEALQRRTRRRATGSCSPARCRRARPPSGTPSWSARWPGPAPGSPSTPATSRSAPSSSGSRRGAPHLMKPNGHELASLTGHDGDELEKRPGRRGPGRAASWSAAGSRACSPRWAATAPSWSTAGRRLARDPAPDHRRQHRRRGRLQPVRLPARRPRGPRSRRPAAPSPSPTAAPPPGCPAPPSPTRTRSTPPWSRVSRPRPHRKENDPCPT